MATSFSPPTSPTETPSSPQRWSGSCRLTCLTRTRGRFCGTTALTTTAFNRGPAAGHDAAGAGPVLARTGAVVHPPRSKYGGVTQPPVLPLLLLPGCGGEEALLPTCVLLHVRRSTTRITALYIEGYGERPAAKPSNGRGNTWLRRCATTRSSTS